MPNTSTLMTCPVVRSNLTVSLCVRVITKSPLKWVGIGLLVLVGVLIVAAVGLSVTGGNRLNKTHDIEVAAVTIPTDEASVARGEKLANAVCKSCHGDDLRGAVIEIDGSRWTVERIEEDDGHTLQVGVRPGG